MAYTIYTDFESSFVKTIQQTNNVLSMQCIPIISHQNAPQPTSDYVMINTLQMIATGGADYQRGVLVWDNVQTKQYSVQNYEVMIQLNFYGTGAANNAMTLHSQLSGNTVVRECFTRNNLAIRRKTDVRRAPQLRENVWVNSYAFDLTLGFAVRTAQDIDWADYITVNGNSIPLP